MGQLLIRKLEESLKQDLKRRAARHGRSMEEEVRTILRDALKAEHAPREGLGTRIARRFAGTGLKEDIPEIRGPARPATFDE